MKLTLHDTLETLYAAGSSPYINEAVPEGTAKAKLEATVSTGYTDKLLAEEWNDLKDLLDDDYQTFRNELINTFSAAATWDALTENLTGTVSVTAAAAAVVGVGTLFTSELKVGNEITISGESFHVASITDDLNLTIDANHVAGAAAVVATTDKQKQALVRNYVWKSAETTPNLNKLYTLAKRNKFKRKSIRLMNNCDCNLQKSPDGTYWNMVPDDTGTLVTTELKTDVVI